MKTIALLAAAGGLLVGLPAAAWEAIPSYFIGKTYSGYFFGGAGFAFMPQTNLAITSLGFCGPDVTNEPVRVALWNTNGQQLVSAIVTTNSTFVNQTHYQSITPLALLAGQTYYLSSVGTRSGLWEGYTVPAPDGGGGFTVASDLSYLASATGTNSAGNFPGTLGSPTVLTIGPNFVYSVLTHPLIWLTGVHRQNGQSQIGFSVSAGSLSSFSLLEAPQPTGPWTTNLTASLTTNTPGVSYTFTASAGGTNRFYIVQSP